MIAHIEHYNNELVKSLDDKLFFKDYINAQLFVDFGCADGQLLRRLKQLSPEIEGIGYDINPQMIKLSKQYSNAYTVFDKWEDIENVIKKKNKTTALILSSVIHEVYSYGTGKDIAIFWERVFNTGFNYISIRDTMLSKNDTNPQYCPNKIYDTYDSQKIEQWEQKWGNLQKHKSLIHFLLTYSYINHWEREYKENYLPISIEELLAYIPKNYSIILQEHFTLPYLKKKVYKDFKIKLSTNTHCKLILQKVA